MSDPQPTTDRELTDGEEFILHLIQSRFELAAYTINTKYENSFPLSVNRFEELLAEAFLYRERVIEGHRLGIVPLSAIPTVFSLMIQDIDQMLVPLPTIQCADGWTISIRVGEDDAVTLGPYGVTHAEVGQITAPAPELTDYPETARGTYGYVPIAVIAAVIEQHGGMTAFLDLDYEINACLSITKHLGQSPPPPGAVQ